MSDLQGQRAVAVSSTLALSYLIDPPLLSSPREPKRTAVIVHGSTAFPTVNLFPFSFTKISTNCRPYNFRSKGITGS